MAAETKVIYAKVELSKEEIAQKAADLSETLTQLEVKEDDKTAVMAQFKSEIEALKNSASSLKNCVRDGCEWRNVRCEIEKDFKKGVVRYIHIESGQIVKTEPMTEDDRQLGITDKVVGGAV